MKTSRETPNVASISGRLSTRIPRSILIIALTLFMSVIDAPTLGGQVGRAAAPHRQNDRVISLIVHLANQAYLSRDIQFAVRAQAQAGALIWSYDRDQARAIFSRAFHQLSPSASDPRSASELERTRGQQLRVELLNRIASCDPVMAETLARSFALSRKPVMGARATLAAFDGSPTIAADHGPADAESRELLVGVALRVAESDSARATQLGQLSLEAGLSPYFGRLLTLIGESEPALSTRLFSGAVDYLERAGRVSPGDLHALSFYLISSVGTSAKDRRTRAVIVRFLNLACDFVMRNCPTGQAVAPQNVTDESYDIYCTGKYLMELLPRYLPDRAARLQSRLSEADDQKPPDAAAGISAAQSIHPFAIDQTARDSMDARGRDLLYAKAAFGWLAREDMPKAQQSASNISSAEMRDRTFLTIARRLMSKARIKDALLIASLIQDRVVKTDMIARLAQAMFSLRNTTCARTLLDLAEVEAAKIEGPFARAQLLLVIAADYSPFDGARAFGVMREAVKAINAIPARAPEALNLKQPISADANTQAEDLFNLGFVNSFPALARVDFEQALLLSQQLNDNDISLIAQLAVCQGGLRPGGFKQR
jgi:hypothetical protein